MDHQKYYTTNKKYSNFLENQERESFRKYSDYLIKYSKAKNKILDVGCGTGIALELVRKRTIRLLHGIDVSRESIKIAKKKKLNCITYNGKKMPYDSSFFDLVGSINVLEHTDNPIYFLNEQLRILKNDGYLIISTPNFLSITNGYHHHTRGAIQKAKNLFSIISRLIRPRSDFEKMETINREDFQPDDDACNITNPLDILSWAKSNNLQLVEWSSQHSYDVGIKKVLDRGIIKLFLGASFMVFKK